MKIHFCATLVAVASLVGVVGAGAKSNMSHSGSMGSMSSMGRMHSGMMKGRIIGNKKTHVYHMAGDTGNMPDEKNRVYFRTVSEARAAGYHLAGSQSGHMSNSHMSNGHMSNSHMSSGHMSNGHMSGGNMSHMGH